MRTVTLKTGEKVPVLGLGTWRMGERKSERAAEVAAVQTRAQLGLRLVDTAEMYGEGIAEEIVGEAMGKLRDNLPRQQGLSPQRLEEGRDAACDTAPAEDRPPRSLSPALAGLLPPGRDRGGLRDAREGRKTGPGASATSMPTTWTSWRRAERQELRLQPGPLSPGLARHRLRCCPNARSPTS